MMPHRSEGRSGRLDCVASGDRLEPTALAVDAVDLRMWRGIDSPCLRSVALEPVIKVIDPPSDCAVPVTFEAASSELDGDSLTHMWWVPPWFLGTGNLLDAKLPPGSYHVYLTSFDSSGRFD